MMELRIETELGELPASWRVGPLGEFLSEAQYGTSVKGAAAGGCPILRMTNQANGRITPVNLQYTNLSARELGKFRVTRGDILFNRTNSLELVGRTAIFDLDGEYVFASYLIRLRTLAAVLDPFVLNAYLNAAETQRRLKSIATRAVSQSNISASRLRTFVVPVPPVAEQRKIVKVVQLAQRALEQQERLISLTIELKKAFLHKLFTTGLRHESQKETEIGLVPESWDVVKLSDVCTFQSGGTPSKQRADYWEGTIPWVSPKDMKRPRLTDVTDHISQEGLEEGSKLAPTGSVFVVVRGMILAKDIPVALAEVPMAINQDMKAIIPGPRLHPDFLLYAMSAFKKRLFEKVGRSAHGTMTLMSSEITNFQIPVPDKKTQQQIANILATLEKKQELHQRKHATLTALFRSLLHHLMTAEISVHGFDLAELESAVAA
jgi:type I restriction enzyme, S subunit